MEHPRTDQQNRAMHKFFELVAAELNDAGLSIEEVLQNFTMELDWNKDTVKEIIWKTAQRRLLGKESTRTLNKQDDITRVYEAVNRFLAQLGIHVPFPTYEQLGFKDTAPMKGDEVHYKS
jgi:hypothetical protein